MSRDRATDILDVLSVTGGVPRYLGEVNPALPAARVANACKMGLSWGLSLKFFMRKFWAAVFEIENSRPIFSSAASRYRADKKRHMIVVVSIGG